jgi:hypothetical protein
MCASGQRTCGIGIDAGTPSRLGSRAHAIVATTFSNAVMMTEELHNDRLSSMADPSRKLPTTKLKCIGINHANLTAAKGRAFNKHLILLRK